MRRVVLVLLIEAALFSIFVAVWAGVGSAAQAPSPAKVAGMIAADKGVEGVRCTRGPIRDKAATFLCVVKVRSGCVAALFQFRHGEIGWYRSSARPVKCWKTEGGPTS